MFHNNNQQNYQRVALAAPAAPSQVLGVEGYAIYARLYEAYLSAMVGLNSSSRAVVAATGSSLGEQTGSSGKGKETSAPVAKARRSKKTRKGTSSIPAGPSVLSVKRAKADLLSARAELTRAKAEKIGSSHVRSGGSIASSFASIATVRETYPVCRIRPDGSGCRDKMNCGVTSGQEEADSNCAFGYTLTTPGKHRAKKSYAQVVAALSAVSEADEPEVDLDSSNHVTWEVESCAESLSENCQFKDTCSKYKADPGGCEKKLRASLDF